MIKVFVSFDYDTDRDLYGNLVEQTERGDAPMKIIDQSLPAAVHDEDWKRQARTRIRQAEAVIFICGVNTHSAKGVEAEMSITQFERKRYVLLQGRRHMSCSTPRNARATDVMQRWKWRKLGRLLRG